MRAARKSSFGELVGYLISDQGNEVRVGDVRITNCESPDVGSAVLEVLSIQAQNRRATADKTYHLILSFPGGEEPPAATMRGIEDRVCAALGFNGHQRIRVVHRDTDYLHIHLAINKVHPKTLKAHDPWQDFRSLAKVCEEVEVEFSLQRDNHASRRRHMESAPRDVERRTGVESLASWIQRTCAEDLLRARSWPELQQHAERCGLALRSRGSGLVFVNTSGLAVRASLVDRALSKGALESRLGPFVSTPSDRTAEVESINDRVGVPSAGRGPDEPVTGDAISASQVLNPAALLSCGSWSEFHDMLVVSGFRARLRGAGLVLEAGGHQTRASDLSRRLSLHSLEQRWGPFVAGDARGQQAGSEPRSRDQSGRLWQLYVETRSAWTGESRDRRRAAARFLQGEIAAALRRAEIKRGLIRCLGRGRASKHLLYVSTHATLRREIEAIKARHARRVVAIGGGGHRLSWTDWLRCRALQGDGRALLLLRKQVPATVAETNSFVGRSRSGGQSLGQAQAVTRNGTVICRQGAVEWRETPNAFVVTSAVGPAELASILALASRRLGPRLKVAGTTEFKHLAVAAAVLAQLAVVFDDPELEALRQSRASTKKPDETAKETRDGPGWKRPGSTRHAVASRRRRLLHQSDAAGDGQPSASGAAVGLRTMSQLDVVQFAARGEVLLPDHARGHLEHSRPSPDDPLRWNDALRSSDPANPPLSTPMVDENAARRRGGRPSALGKR